MVQYKGNAPALNALIAGEINLLFDVVNTAAAQVKGGRARAIASTSRRPPAAFADLPVASEVIADMELVAWQGVMAPPSTPREILSRMNREISAAIEQPAVRKRLVDTGLEVVTGPVEAFEQLIRRDYDKYTRVLKAAGVKPE